MANNKSAEKRVRQTETRTLRNKSMKTRVKNARRGLNQATAAKGYSSPTSTPT
jgi:small subunit ribosomal protein S20